MAGRYPNRASYADCYRLLRLEIFTPTIFITPKKVEKKHLWGRVMLNQWEIHIKDSCKAHSKINRKIFAVYGSNDVIQPKNGPFWG